MIADRTQPHRGAWVDRGLLWVLVGFTLVALFGYAFFTVPPHGPRNLARFSQYPAILRFYTVSFSFFAQAHVWLTALVLGAYLVRKVGGLWLAALGAIYLTSFLSEFIGTTYGVPFGPYGYTEWLGPKWLGQVPWVIPLSWFTMAVPSYVLACYAFPDRRRPLRRVLFAAFLLACWDLTLDPAMSYLTSYWTWDEAGPYYGMPLVNLVGWYVTGLALMGLLWALHAERWVRRLSVRWMAGYYAATLLMPIGMVVVAGLWGAVAATAVGLGAGAAVMAFQRRSRPGSSATGRPAVAPARPAATATPAAEDPEAATSQAALTARLPHDLDVFFARNSRTFSFAARWFDAAARQHVRRVYAFCRITDDLVDRPGALPPAAVAQRLAVWQTMVERGYRGQRHGVPWLDALLADSARAGVPLEHLTDLIAGVRMDLGTVALQSQAELRLYAYRVASVVGLWLCHLLGVHEEALLQRAIAMGQALQLTNILRDVGEDLAHGRIYLPADLMAAHGVTPSDLYAMQAGGPITPAYRRLIRTLMDQADADYRAAWAGIARLPRPFGRAAAVAAAVYRGIQHRIRFQGYDNFGYRARTRLPEKVFWATGAHFRLYRLRRRTAPPSPTDARPALIH